MTYIYKKVIAWTVLAIITIGTILFFSIKGCSHNNSEKLDYKSLYHQEQSESKTWKDNAQRWHHESAVANVSNAATLATLSENSKEYQKLRQDFTVLKSNLKNLKGYSNTGISTLEVFSAPIHDTITLDTTHKIKTFKYFDPGGWYRATGLISNDSIHLSISSRDSITTVVYWKRKWFLARKNYKQEIISHNPNSEILFSKSLIVEKKR